MLKYWLNKYYKIITSIIAFAINTFGLALSILGAFPGGKWAESRSYVTFLLVSAEIFLILSVIYTIISALNNYHNRISVDEKDAELMRCKSSNRTILENNKASITCYKDFHDRLNIFAKQHKAKIEEIYFLRRIDNESRSYNQSNQEISQYLEKVISEERESIKTELIELYNRFIINLINLTRDSIEEYISTKGCNVPVSIALKQLEEPTNYNKINDKEDKIYTAFRDSKTYRSKTRNETWQKSFCIRKNSDFLSSIEKDYYIFNYVNKTFLENGLYLNENNNFYEYYNSGVTCTIYSCIEKERILYGFLACDSLLDDKMQKKGGQNVYDYNVANMMMAAAHIIAIFLKEFLLVWDNYYVRYDQDVLNSSENYETFKKERNLCQVMIQRVKNTRYTG